MDSILYKKVDKFCKECFKKSFKSRGRRDRDRMVVGFKATYAISAYHH